jgi:hypothetical protein
MVAGVDRERRARKWTGAVLAAGAGAAALGAATASNSAVTPCWVDHGAVVAAAAFGDIAGDFIIDLSRPASALHVTRANSDGIVADAATGPLTIAGQTIGAYRMAVAGLDLETASFDTAINGIIGWDVLGRYDVTLDLRGGQCRLTLADPGPRAAHIGTRTTLEEIGGAPAVHAVVSDGVSALSGEFRIDTGHAATRVREAHLSRPASRPADPVRLRALSLDGVLFEQIPAAAGGEATDGLGGSIGTAVWRGAVLRLSRARGEVDLRLAP